MLSSLTRWLKRLLVLIWLLAMAVVGMWLYWENAQLVTLRVPGLGGSEQALGLIVCAMLFAGAILGYVTCLVTFKSKAVWYKRRYHKSQKLLEQQLDKDVKP